MRKIYQVTGILFSWIALSACNENVQSASITLKAEGKFTEYRFTFNTSQTSGTASVWMINDRNQLCSRKLPFEEHDARELTALLKGAQACRYSNSMKPCPSNIEESVRVTFRDGSPVKADLSKMTCSPNAQYICGDKADEIRSLAVLMALIYGDKSHPNFECD